MKTLRLLVVLLAVSCHPARHRAPPAPPVEARLEAAPVASSANARSGSPAPWPPEARERSPKLPAVAPSAESLTRELTDQVRRNNQIRERVERLFREAHRSFRLEDYTQAALLYRETLRLDRTIEDAQRWVDLADLAASRKAADQPRRELIEEWLRLTERTEAANLTQPEVVTFADEDTWREVAKRQPRDRGAARINDFAGPEVDLTPPTGSGGGDGLPNVAMADARVLPPSAEGPTSPLPPLCSRLRVGDRECLPQRSLSVAARVDGHRARITVDFVFDNDRDQQLEGTFELRLPPGANPHSLAFGAAADVPRAVTGGAPLPDVPESPPSSPTATASDAPPLKEARIVARELARTAYTQTVRRRVDPALLEWSGAGMFSTRVFPIAPRKPCRIVVGYDLDLVPTDGDHLLRIELPPGLPGIVVDLDVARLTGVRACATPTAEPERRGERDYFRFAHPQAREVTLRLSGLDTSTIVGDDAGVGPCFATRFVPALTDARATTGSARAVFLVDTSRSGASGSFATGLALLEAICERNRPTLREFAVLTFDLETSWWREAFVPNDPEHVARCLADLRALACEGATNLAAALAEGVRPGWLVPAGPARGFDVFLLGDGAPTWGERDANALSRVARSGGDGPIFAYTQGAVGTDAAVLGRLAADTGGAVFDIASDADRARAATAHAARPWRLEGVQIAGATDVLVAGRPAFLYPGQRVSVVGRGVVAAGAAVALVLTRDGERRELVIPLGAPLRSDLAPRAYGQAMVDELERYGEATCAVATAYARHFRIVGQTCSLLMLETEDDYRRFAIVPEADAVQVVRHPGARVAARAEAALAAQLGDPRRALHAWIERLHQLPEVRLALPVALELALATLPDGAFPAPPPPARGPRRRAGEMSAASRTLLAEGEPDALAVALEAESRRRDRGARDAARCLSTVVELGPNDPASARDVALQTWCWGEVDLAYPLLAFVARARPADPGVHLEIAECLEALGTLDLALLHYEVVLHARWADRFRDVHQTAAVRYLSFLRRAQSRLRPALAAWAAARRDGLMRLVGHASIAVMVGIVWNTDANDVDLHVLEPGGEECYYSNPRTKLGGTMSGDVTQGLGPELYCHAAPIPGRYRAWVRYFAPDRNRASTGTHVHVVVVRDWGTSRERSTRELVRLATGTATHELAVLDVE